MGWLIGSSSARFVSGISALYERSWSNVAGSILAWAGHLLRGVGELLVSRRALSPKRGVEDAPAGKRKTMFCRNSLNHSERRSTPIWVTRRLSCNRLSHRCPRNAIIFR